jgi:hypothetical protein
MDCLQLAEVSGFSPVSGNLNQPATRHEVSR